MEFKCFLCSSNILKIIHSSRKFAGELIFRVLQKATQSSSIELSRYERKTRQNLVIYAIGRRIDSQKQVLCMYKEKKIRGCASDHVFRSQEALTNKPKNQKKKKKKKKKKKRTKKRRNKHVKEGEK